MNVLKNHVYFNIDKLGELVKSSLPFYIEGKEYLRSWAKANSNGVEIVIALNSQVLGFLLFDHEYRLYRFSFKNDEVYNYYFKRQGMYMDEELIKEILKGVIHWTH